MTTSTTARLAAAQTARAAARAAFGEAFSAAVQSAIARKIRGMDAIEAAAEADPAVIAARVVSEAAAAELAAAKTAATAAERLSLVEHDARVSAAAMREGDRTPAAPDSGEDAI